MGCLPNFLIPLKSSRGSKNRGATLQLNMMDQKVHDIHDQIDDVIRDYNWVDIERFTLNFSRVIGFGGFSTVYLGDLPGSILGAIKIHTGIYSNHTLYQLFKQELDILLRLRHDNIVKLLGYSQYQEEGALVFEYVPNGSLQEKLHGGAETERESSGSVLSWRSRMTIAFQLAQALEYLHEKCDLQIVHGDIKASNILLDERLNCKLCDFGSAKMGFSSTVMPNSSGMKRLVMMGSPGYTDPHYLRTGIPSKKNDVYSYGVIVLELVTGMQAFCQDRGGGSHCLLTSIMGPMLSNHYNNNDQCEAMNVAEMVDPRLGGDFDIKEARAMLSLASRCLHQSPTLRPSVSQILHTIKHHIPSISFLSSATACKLT